MTIRIAASLSVLAALALGHSVQAAPLLSGCKVFPDNHFWNVRVDTLPMHASSGAWVTTIGSGSSFHPDFGSFYEGDPIGIPFVSVTAAQTPVPVSFDEDDESDAGPYPIPSSAPIEGGPASDGDRHVLVLEQTNCRLYELDYAFPISGGASWEAFSGAKFDLSGYALRSDTFTSADAAGLPILPGLVRYDETMSGEIRHAFRFTAPQTRSAHIWPARHDASVLTGTQYPPMGARFRLKSTYTISPTAAPPVQRILRALKTYGMVLADNGSAWYVSGEHHPAWDDDMLSALKSLKGSDFEAVDTSRLMVQATTAKAFPPPPPVTLRQVASGLTNPVEIANANDGSGRLFIVEKAGLVKILKNGAVLGTPFLNVTALISTSSERGLLGLAFDPQFRTNRRFFVFMVRASDGALQVRSYLASTGNADVADSASGLDVITIAHPGADNHNGGHLAFGPNGYLYIGTGDGGGAGDTANNAQTLSARLGKILRIDVSGATGYTVPASNPFVGTAGAATEIWAYGVRNPWKYSFDRGTGDLYIGDVGQDATEEVDYQPAGVAGGRNYGWRMFEGNGCYNPATGCSLANHTPPILQYAHDANGGRSITGGYVYRGRKSAALRGYYLFGDFVSNRIWAATRVDSSWQYFTLLEPPASPSGVSSFGEDEAGELYVASYNDGRVYAIDGPGPGAPTELDHDGDAKADIRIHNVNDGTEYGWLMNGLTISNGAYLLSANSGWSIAKVADLDGDGKSDILIQHTDGSLYAWIMNGLTVTTGGYVLGAGTGFSLSHVGDFNGDGKADLVFKHTNGSIYVQLMNGVTALNGTYLQGAGSGWSVSHVADFDGDGKSDILLKHTDGSIYIDLMNGISVANGTFLIGAASGWSATATGDFNGDGKADILITHTNGGVYLWQMNGIAITTGTFLQSPATGWSIAMTGDLDGDGKTDIVIKHTDGSHYAWIMNGLSVSTGGYLLGAGTGWSVSHMLDLNGDGKSDILIKHTDGSIYGWLMNGATIANGTYLMGAGPWRVAP
jgi:glucose/arabinose dehydrogenase